MQGTVRHRMNGGDARQRTDAGFRRGHIERRFVAAAVEIPPGMGRDQKKTAVRGEVFDEGFEESLAASFDFADCAERRMDENDLIAGSVHPGEVMLLHPTSDTNAAILGEVIDQCRAMGYRFGTLDELTANG
jgi:hypothetical protein